MLVVASVPRLYPLLLASVATLAACEGGDPHGPANSRSVELSLASSSHDRVTVSKVMVNVKRIEVYAKNTRTWITVADYGTAGRPLDLLTLHADNPQGVGAFELPPGRYEDLRLFVEPEGTILADEGAGPVTRPLEVHDHARKGIEVDGRFQITAAGFTQVALDFDARHSISYHRHGRDHQYEYKVHADIDVVGALTTTTPSVLVSAVEGGEVHLLGRAGLVIPPGALREDTEIEMSVTQVDATYAAKAGLLPGNVIRLEPDGLIFDIPAQLSISFDPSEIKAGLTAADFTVLSRSTGELWKQHATVLSPDRPVMTASISHFSEHASGTLVTAICGPGAAPLPGTTTCLQVPEIELRCENTKAGNVSVYDANGDRVWSRDVKYTHAVNSPAEARLIDHANCASITNKTLCENTDTCGALVEGGVLTCMHDPAYFTLTRTGCGTTSITAWVDGAADTVSTNFTVKTEQPHRAVLDTIRVSYNGDSFGEGEIYWRLEVGGMVISDHPNERGTDDDTTIDVHESASLGYFCPGHQFSVNGFVADEDGGATGEDDVSYISSDPQTARHPIGSYFGPGPSGAMHWGILVCQ